MGGGEYRKYVAIAASRKCTSTDTAGDVSLVAKQQNERPDRNVPKPKKKRRKEKKYQCTICGKRLRGNKLKLHANIHSGETSYTCRYFSKRMHSRSSLMYHPGEMPFKCDTCLGLFGDGTAFRRHKEVCHNCTGTNKSEADMCYALHGEKGTDYKNGRESDDKNSGHCENKKESEAKGGRETDNILSECQNAGSVTENGNFRALCVSVIKDHTYCRRPGQVSSSQKNS
jgi:hypothetical protein